jgi:ArsR family transcriptional regulator
MIMDIWPHSACGARGCESLARLFRDLSHPLRLGVVRRLLADGEECVCGLAGRCGVDQPTLSRHLRILKDHGVVSDRREGSNVFYRVTDPRVAPLLDALGVLETGKRLSFRSEEES